MPAAATSPLRSVPLAVALAAVCGLVTLASASAGTQRYGGTLVIAGSTTIPTLDPTTSSCGTCRAVVNAFCLRLYEYGYDHGKLTMSVPVLAAAPPVLSSDKLSVSVQLRQGIEFNDGTPFNAQAVIATYQRYITYPGSLWASNFADVASASATGPYTVLFRLKQRDSTFLGNMYVLSPAALQSEGASFAAKPICVGPFMFDHQDAGVDAVLVKSPYYYKRGAIRLDKIVFKIGLDGPAAAAALEAGDVQVVQSLDPALLSAVEQNLSLRVLSAQQMRYNGIRINIGNKTGVGNFPYTNVGTPLAASQKLRQAFEEAIDRSTLNKVVFAGTQVPDCTAISPASTLWYTATKVPCTPYDPADARRLVAASGYPPPITVHLLCNTTSLLLAQFVQAEEDAVGFNVVLDTTDGTTQGARTQAGQFDTATGSSTITPDPNDALYNSLDTAGPLNTGGYSNPRFDYVLANGLKATDPKARAVDYHVAQQILHDDRPFIFLYANTNLTAYNATLLAGISPTAQGGVSFVNARYK
jgi:peptide/nickel transport system substrate-binding protein